MRSELLQEKSFTPRKKKLEKQSEEKERGPFYFASAVRRFLPAVLFFSQRVAPAVSTLCTDAINLGLSDCVVLGTRHLQLIINSL